MLAFIEFLILQLITTPADCWIDFKSQQESIRANSFSLLQDSRSVENKSMTAMFSLTIFVVLCDMVSFSFKHKNGKKVCLTYVHITSACLCACGGGVFTTISRRIWKKMTFMPDHDVQLQSLTNVSDEQTT